MRVRALPSCMRVTERASASTHRTRPTSPGQIPSLGRSEHSTPGTFPEATASHRAFRDRSPRSRTASVATSSSAEPQETVGSELSATTSSMAWALTPETS